MADNTVLAAGAGGDTMRTLDKAGVKTPASMIDVGGAGAESLVGDSGVGMPTLGMAAENAPVAGNPVLIAGRYDLTPRVLGDGDVGAIAIDPDGAVHISDGGNSLTIDGTVTANAGTGTFTVDGSGVTQPISAASLPLPSGAATSANQSTANTSLSNIEAGVAAEGAALGSGVLLQGDDGVDRKNVNVDATTGDLQVDITHTVIVDGSGVTQPVSHTGLTELAAAINASRLDVNLAASAATVTVDGSGVTQPVSGTITANAGTGDFLSIAAHTINEAFKEATAIGGQLDDTATVAATEGNIAPVRITAQRSLHTTMRDDDGDSVMDNTNNAIRANIVAGSASGTEFNEDDPASGGEAGPAILGVRRDADTSPVSLDGDFQNLIFDASGFLKVNVKAGAGGPEDTDDDAIAGGQSNVRSNALAYVWDGVDWSRAATGTGVRTAQTQRVTIATDDVVPVSGTITADAGTGTFTVDNGGTFAVQASVDELSAAVAISTDNNVAPTTAQVYGHLLGFDGTDWARVRTTTGGVLQVDGSGVTQPISASSLPLPSGASTSANQSTANTSLSNIEAGVAAEGTALGSGILLQGDDGVDRKNVNVDATSGNLQIDVVNTVTVDGSGVTQPVSAASLPLPAGAATSASQLADGHSVTAAATASNIGAAAMTNVVHDGTTALTPKFAVIDDAASPDNTLVAAVASKKIRVLSLMLMSAGTVNARFEDGTGGTALTGQMNLVANSGFVLPFNPVGWFETGVNTLLNLELSAAVSLDGMLTYVEV